MSALWGFRKNDNPLPLHGLAAGSYATVEIAEGDVVVWTLLPNGSILTTFSRPNRCHKVDDGRHEPGSVGAYMFKAKLDAIRDGARLTA